MWLLGMAWKNLWRNKNRTAISMASIFFAVVLSVLSSSLQQGIFDNLVKNVVSFYSGYIQVHKVGYWDEQIIDNSFSRSRGVEKRLKAAENVSGVAPRLEVFALIASRELTKGTMIMGVEPDAENRITRLQKKIVKGHYLTSADNAVLLAEGLAKRLHVKIRDTVTIIGQGYHGATAAGKFPVKGILRFGVPQLNDQALVMPLSATQNMYGAEGMITSYVLSLRNIHALDGTAGAVRSHLGPAYEVLTWEEIMPDIRQHIESDTNNMRAISGILYLLISFGIFGTLSMMMVERRFEMGMLVAIGMKKALLAQLLLWESLLIVGTGCLLGILASIPLVFYLNRHPVTLEGDTAAAFERFGFEPIFPTATDPSNFINQGMTVLGIGLLLSLYPIYKVIRLNALTAMKR